MVWVNHIDRQESWNCKEQELGESSDYTVQCADLTPLEEMGDGKVNPSSGAA